MQTNTPPRAEFLPIDKLRPFENHPFRVKDDAEMDQLVFSVLTQGLLTPIVVRETDTAEYEVISGHRRLRACQKAGIETVPALIYSIDRDAAIIALVDSNLHREHLLPSEKAFAYRMKMEAMSHQGQRSDLTSSQVATKLDSAYKIIGHVNLHCWLDDGWQKPETFHLHISSVLLISVYKTRCLPGSSRSGVWGIPQQAKIRLGSTQTLLAATTNH